MRYLLVRLCVKIKAQIFIIFLYGKGKRALILRETVDSFETSRAKKRIYAFDSDFNVVNDRAVEIPDYIFIFNLSSAVNFVLKREKAGRLRLNAVCPLFSA